ncbi:nucleopolyhedrovirus P10 family protein [Streptomyces sp. NPDC050145]|uniref:nucleopolyhedrovirus P10 family protein n=1 Tax=Streptomyces sp. NPDC050145 TaxID=3365602 RepID=UPI0037A7F7EC
MTADRWTQAVRHHLGLGRLLPLGGPGDGAWIAEPAAGAVLRRSVDGLPGLRLGVLRLALAETDTDTDTDTAYEAGVPAPPSALPPRPLRIVAECAAVPDEPLPGAAGRLRAALAEAADTGLGLVVAEIDVRVTELLEPGAAPGSEQQEEPQAPEEKSPPGADPSGDAGRVADAARAVPGVARLTGALGGLGRPVHLEERAAEQHGGAALPRRHVRVELAVARGARALDVARAVREAVAAALPDTPTVAVLVTESAD